VAAETPPDSPRNAKAELKAAKAYAKAERPWYKKKRYIALGFLGLIVVISVAAGGGGDSSKTTSNATSPPAAAPPAGETPKANTPPPPPAESNGPTAKLPIQNGDWRLDSIRVKDNGLGDFGGTGRVTYTGANPDGGANVFTLTVFVDDKDIAVLNGSASSVKPGRTVTVEFISSDNFVGGPYKYDFQNDF
jgi:hypothetical protein